jgi:UPF0042 nucleotide-binding protein
MITDGGRGPAGFARWPRETRVLLVTGMSGAGRSTALKTLEDLGYEAIDNLPLSLVPTLIKHAAADAPSGCSLRSRGVGAIAIGADARTRGFGIAAMLETLETVVRRTGRDLGVLFVDCDDERLARRYTETRRPHPLASDRPLGDAIRSERRAISALRERADLVIDTSALSAADLRRLLYGHFALPGSRLRLFVTSFAYRHGVPREADLVFDVRFLDNPYYVAALRPLCGLDPPVAAYIARDAEFEPFFDRLWRLLRPLLPRYEREGRAYLTIAIGCTGGRHRSVFVAERLAARLRAENLPVEVGHRDLSASGSFAALAPSIAS